MGLVLVMAAGAFANGGIIVSDRSGIIVSDKPVRENTCKEGIIVSDGPIASIIDFIAGIIITDRAQCSDGKSGIIVSDRSGIIVSD